MSLPNSRAPSGGIVVYGRTVGEWQEMAEGSCNRPATNGVQPSGQWNNGDGERADAKMQNLHLSAVDIEPNPLVWNASD